MGNPPFRPIREIESAVQRGELRTAVALARDFSAEHKRPVPLGVALKLLPLIAQHSGREYDAYALRWLVRWLAETPAPTIEQAAEVATSLAELPAEPLGAAQALNEAV